MTLRCQTCDQVFRVEHAPVTCPCCGRDYTDAVIVAFIAQVNRAARLVWAPLERVGHS